MAGKIRLQRAKVIATLGPASAREETILAMAEAGADGFRINASHAPPAEFGRLVRQVRDAERATGRPLAVLCDLPGPKLRVHASAAEQEVGAGDQLLVGPPGSDAAVPLEGFDVCAELKPGARVLLHDGSLRLRVLKVRPPLVLMEAETGGRVAPRMGINLPDFETLLPSLAARDLAALEAGVAAGVDVFALSFVRRASDVAELRRRLTGMGSHAPIVAKIEKAQATAPEELEAILSHTEMVMVARGDLGAETAPERVPVLQKDIVRRARAHGVPVIVATEMLESMVRSPRPTRAEASDVANAVFDGVDALLLTAETAIGVHPVLAVETCVRVIAGAEAFPAFRVNWGQDGLPSAPPDQVVANAVARAAVVAAADAGASAVVCFTTSGRTARLVARHRPSVPILALTPQPQVARALALVWGVEAVMVAETPAEHEGVVALAEREAVAHGVTSAGSWLVVTHGAPLKAQPPTNVMRVHRVVRAATGQDSGTQPPQAG